jgi:regulator of sigma E protease
VTMVVVILGLGLLVFLHELGHFVVARLVGIRPRAFSIGFPPTLAKVERNGVEYAIGAIPLGGYVRIPGMHRPAASDFEARISPAVREDPLLARAANVLGRRLEEEDFDGARGVLSDLEAALERARLSRAARRSAEQAVREVDESTGADAYWRQPTRKRVAVIAAGPATNVLVAFALFFVVYVTGAPSNVPTTEVAQVEAGTPAAAAGLEEGDRIVAVGGRPTRTFTDVSQSLRASRGRAITVTVERDGQSVTLGPTRAVAREGRWVWGFVPAAELVSHPPGESARLAIDACWLVATGTVASIGDLFRPGAASTISGPVGVVRASAQYLDLGLAWYLQLLGLISMSLALFNLLPLLPLDGGHIVVSLVEGVRRRALPQRAYERFSAIGTALIVLVMVIALSNDIGVAPR